ncbi:MAG: ABC transporter permease, partial [Cyclobacteriaceae bacterium]|nr:ABC transporter permease [Cyclobacteriaceae bacterium HetDA_MAG_MS6]
MNRPKTHPPRWANWLLEWFCDDHQIEILQGDLYELFEKRMELKGSFRAKIYFVLDVLGVLRPFARKRKRSTHYNLFDMLRNYLTITYRNIRSQKTYSFINAAGLAIGLACFILIFLYIQDELSFDRMHEKSDRIYRLHERFQSDGIGEHSASQPFPVAPTLLNDCAHLMDY